MELTKLSQEKEQLASSKQEREKENQGLQQELTTLKQQVRTNTYTNPPGCVSLNVFLIQITQALIEFTNLDFFQVNKVNWKT